MFPNGTHDDQVDALTQALRNMGKVSTVRTFEMEFRNATPQPTVIDSSLAFAPKIRALSAARRHAKARGYVGIGSVRVGR